MMQSFSQYVAQHSAFNIARTEMPQIKDPEAFVQYLNFVGIPVEKVDQALKTLSPTQVNFDQAKVDSITAPYGTIIVSDVGHILDGHHRYLAALADPETSSISTYQCAAPINQLLKHAKDFLEDE